MMAKGEDDVTKGGGERRREWVLDCGISCFVKGICEKRRFRM
jgi:hypothetical protein